MECPDRGSLAACQPGRTRDRGAQLVGARGGEVSSTGSCASSKRSGPSSRHSPIGTKLDREARRVDGHRLAQPVGDLLGALELVSPQSGWPLQSVRGRGSAVGVESPGRQRQPASSRRSCLAGRRCPAGRWVRCRRRALPEGDPWRQPERGDRRGVDHRQDDPRPDDARLISRVSGLRLRAPCRRPLQRSCSCGRRIWTVADSPPQLSGSLLSPATVRRSKLNGCSIHRSTHGSGASAASERCTTFEDGDG